MPRFAIETRVELNDVLTALGMQLAFDSRADYTGIHGPETAQDRIHISKVIHQANIDVDEKGTEAAAATAVGMDAGGGPGRSTRSRSASTTHSCSSCAMSGRAPSCSWDASQTRA